MSSRTGSYDPEDGIRDPTHHWPPNPVPLNMRVRNETGQNSKARNVVDPCVERKGRIVKPTEQQKEKMHMKEQ